MSAICQIGAVAVLIASLLTPAMACMLPQHRATTAEKVCCQRMHGDCGAMQMAVSQPCCQMQAQNSSALLVQPLHVPSAAAASAEIMVLPAPGRPLTAFSNVPIRISSSHSPPILRI